MKVIKIKKILLIFILSILFLNSLLSCSNTKESTKTKEPSWISEIPKDENYYYFLGSGGPVNEESEGEKIALNDIQSKLFLLIGATVNSYLENNQVYISSNNKEEFSTYLKSIVNVEGKGIISQFEIVDKYLKKTSDNKIIVYILARISKESVIKEQKRLEKIYQEKLESFLIPEQKANSYLKNDLFYEAIFEFIKASRNAFLSDYENRVIVAERNLDKILEISKNLKSNLIVPSTTLYSNEQQGEPFIFEVLYSDGNVNKPVKNIPVKFFYKDLNNNGEIITKEYKTNTSSSGKATFLYNRVPFAGNSSIIAFVDILDIIDDYIRIVSSNNNLKEKANIIRNNFTSLKQSKNYFVSSKTISLKTFILFQFYDNSGNLMQGLNISNFLSNLTKLGVKFSKSLNINPEKNENINSFLSFYRNDFLKNDIERVIFIRGDFKNSKEYSGKQISTIDLNSYIYIPKEDNIKYFSITANGTGDNIILSLIDAYLKGLDKLYTILTMIL